MESVYNLIPVPVEVREKPVMYKSHHHHTAELVGSTLCKIELTLEILYLLLITPILGTHGTTLIPGAGRISKVPLEDIALHSLLVFDHCAS